MRVLIISNDVIPGFGVPVAAPGLRAAGLAAGLSSHGHDVTVAVPADVLQQLFGDDLPPAPAGSQVVSPPDLMEVIALGNTDVVVFINANLTPHLRPIAGVHFVYDMFAPKLLESLASDAARPWKEQSAEKERAMALADSVWVNGARKLGYALDWILRPEVERIRTVDFQRSSIVDADTVDRLTLVEMPVDLPRALEPVGGDPVSGERRRLGIAGYAQAWSTLDDVHHGHQTLIAAGHELHALLPGHWGGNPSAAPRTALPDDVITHTGPLLFEEFATWVQGMDAMVDVFEPSAERRFAMITRSAVALRLGVPLIHAVDSEISDIVTEHNAGWAFDPDDEVAWSTVANELADPAILTTKRAGALEASRRFSPSTSLAAASRSLDSLHTDRR